MNKLLSALIISASLFSSVTFAATQTIKANVNGMVCAFCAQGIEKKMRAQPQTKDVYVNLKQHLVAIELKDGQSLSNDMVKSLISEAGYNVTSIEMSDNSIKQLKAELEAK